jgi:hypothetical protein
MLTYFDTSVLIKSFVLEPRSEEAVALIESTDTGIPISHFSSIEFTNALQLKKVDRVVPDPRCCLREGDGASDVLCVTKSARARFREATRIACQGRARNYRCKHSPNV